MTQFDRDAFVLTQPRVEALPLLFDSPHSGRHYPVDWITPLPLTELRRGEDAYVDALLERGPDFGITLLAAHFPRCYIDVNRDVDDIDPELLAGPWTGGSTLRPSEKSRKGLGLIRRYVVPGKAIVERPLPVAEVRARIERIYVPYHAALAAQLDALRTRFGFVWLVDWHSMKSRGNAMTPDGEGTLRPDMVVGDRHGMSAEPRFVELVVGHLRELGYRVSVNDPYKGATIVRRYGDPARGYSALQIEVNRALYLDESTVECIDEFARLQRSVESLMQVLVRAARTR
jgi:N-formylglutamate deformylase